MEVYIKTSTQVCYTFCASKCKWQQNTKVCMMWAATAPNIWYFTTKSAIIITITSPRQKRNSNHIREELNTR